MPHVQRKHIDPDSISSPEIAYDDLTPDRFASIIGQHGGMLIRSLFKSEEAEELIQEVRDLYFLIDNLQSNGLMTKNGVQYLKGGHPCNLLPNMRLIQNLLNKPRFIESLQSYFNDPELVAYLEPTCVRYCNPTGWQNYLSWHQDKFHRGDTFFTIWIPLNRVGDDAPGLELLPYKLYERIHTAASGLDVTYDGKGISEEDINREVGTDRFHPIMDVGDILIFDPYTAHRTYVTKGMTEARISLDIRLNPLSANPCAPNSNEINEVWATEMVRLPASSPVQKVGKGRTQFDIKHLLLQVVPEPEAVTQNTEGVAQPVTNG